MAGMYRCTWYMLRRARRKLLLSHPPKLGDPPCTRELIAPFAPPTTAPAAITTSTHLWHIDHRPFVLLYYFVLWKDLYRVGGRDGSVPSPVFGFIQNWGRLCTVCLGLCSGERLYCSLCCGFVQQGGGGSLPSPVFDFIHHRGGQLYRPLCLVLYSI